MKNLCTLFLTLFVASSVWAYDFLIDGIAYNIVNANEVAVASNDDYEIQQSRYSGDIVIPSSVMYNGNNYSVTSIGGGSFSYSGVTSITIPNSVTSIGGGAFMYSPLTSITIPDHVTSIGASTFYFCSRLTSITIPNGVTSIGDNAFYNCSSLTSITIPNVVTSIGRSAFAGCSSLTSVTIPNSVTSIGECAFSGCSGLTSVTIPNGVTSIGRETFWGCSGLTSVTIPNGVTSIGNNAFNDCSSLTSITIPNSITSIGDGAFGYCSSLQSVTILSSELELIENDKGETPEIFYGCWNLKEYSGPACALLSGYGDSELFEKITFTSGALDRDGFDFINLSYRTLQEIDLSGIENTEIPDMAFNNCYKLEKVSLPAQLESVGYKSFAGCTALKGISLPASVTKIDNSAFEDCRKMEKILFDGSDLKASTSNLETIGDWAFYNCHNLKSLEIPEGVTSLGDAAFYGCTYLQDLKLPSTLKSMGDNTFALCENLKSMTILAENPPSLYEKSFYNVDHTIPVSVPESSLKAYAETEYWSEFVHYKSADEQGGSTAISEVSNATAVTIVNGQILVNGEAPAFVVTVSGQKIANANLKAGVYFVVVDGETVGVSVR